MKHWRVLTALKTLNANLRTNIICHVPLTCWGSYRLRKNSQRKLRISIKLFKRSIQIACRR